jgi:hypothetical protein
MSMALLRENIEIIAKGISKSSVFEEYLRGAGDYSTPEASAQDC